MFFLTHTERILLLLINQNEFCRNPLHKILCQSAVAWVKHLIRQAADSDTSVLTNTFLNSHCIFISFAHGQISRTNKHCNLKSIHLQTWKKAIK